MAKKSKKSDNPFACLEECMSEATDAYEELSAEWEAARSALLETKKEYDRKTKDFDKLETSYRELESSSSDRFAALDAELADLRETVKIKDGELLSLRDTVKTKDSELERLRHIVSVVRRELDVRK